MSTAKIREIELANATTEEWEKVKGGKMLLLEGWSLHHAQIFARKKVLQTAESE